MGWPLVTPSGLYWLQFKRPQTMILTANQIYTLQCQTPRHNITLASDDFREVQAEALVLCKATNEVVNIYHHGSANVQGNVTPEFVAMLGLAERAYASLETDPGTWGE
jgi:hypothetical protein